MAVLYQEIIRRKRDGEALDASQIKALVEGITNESMSDAQIAAFAMAVYFQGMTTQETVALTLAMRDSGEVLSWPMIDNPIVDKHSTGGVGDNVSLMLAPMAAACGLCVPMISGRGLGHTGGTLDKMDSIPGYVSQPSSEQFLEVTKNVGCAIIGQTANLAPADKRFYGVRDVTSTVENIPLITASILSKKLAAGLGWLVLDVKFGNGAFMHDLEAASALAKSLVKTATDADTKTVALLTDMNQPLASAVGNGLEVVNAVEFLTGKHRDPRLEQVTVQLVAHMVAQASAMDSLDAAVEKVRQKLDDGSAAAIFDQMVSALGGPDNFCQTYAEHLPTAPLVEDLVVAEDGYVTAIDTRSVGVAVVEMGGGRRNREDEVDHAVGLTNLLPIGSRVSQGDRLCTIHARDHAMFERASATVRSAYSIGSTKPAETDVVAKIID